MPLPPVKFLPVLLILTLLPGACGTGPHGGQPFPYRVQWELEYLSGPRIAFEGLFPEKKPILAFSPEGMATGNRGCNGYSAPVEIDGNRIAFGEPGPTTLMYCGPGENMFREMLGKIDGWQVDADGKLNLLLGDIPMMRFRPFAD